MRIDLSSAQRCTCENILAKVSFVSSAAYIYICMYMYLSISLLATVDVRANVLAYEPGIHRPWYSGNKLGDKGFL